LRADTSRYLDLAQLRSRRILVPLAAWLVALGREDWIDGSYIALVLLSIGLGVYWTARLMENRGLSAMWGAVFLAMPSTLIALDRMAVDGPFTTLFAGFFLYCEEKKWKWAWLLAGLATLTRETGLFLVAGLAAVQLFQRNWRRAAWFAASAVPAAFWFTYLHFTLPAEAVVHFLPVPGLGLIQRLPLVRPYPLSRFQTLVQITDFLAVVGLMACIYIALRANWNRRWDPASLASGLFALLATFFGPAVMIESYGYSRLVSPMLLWILVAGVTQRSWLRIAAPLMLTLSAGILYFDPLLRILRALREAVFR